jgi:ParB family transcriptional regulator, chromosome partitioning protein
MNTQGRRLGRGLGGLIQSTIHEPSQEEVKSADSLPVAEIRANPFQPRRHFDAAALDELKESIREHGVLQPIVVRRGAVGYEVVAGERRLRASRDLGLGHIPAVIRDVDDAGMQTLALVENLQREDLNPLEKARALKAMMGAQGLTQEAVAARVGKDRVTIANLLRLLDLPEEVRTWIEEGKLSAGQARAILQVQGDPKRVQMARLALDRELSVRDIERLARLTTGGGGKKGVRAAKDPFVADLEDRIRRALSAKVTVKAKRRGGVIEIEYADATELDALLQRMGAV